MASNDDLVLTSALSMLPKRSVRMKELLLGFSERKELAEFDIFVPRDDLWGYIWGKTMCFVKKGLIGNISDRYVS